MTFMAITRRSLLASSILAIATPSIAVSRPTYRNAAAPVEDRVADLVGRMTLDEKVAQLRSMWTDKLKIYDAKGDFSRKAATAFIPHGVGQVGRVSDYRGLPRFDTNPFRSIDNTVAFANAMQRFMVEETRLGIPVLFHDELAHGLLAGEATFADIFYGRTNPGGKLTVSIPRSEGELPVFYNRAPSADVNQYIEGKRVALFPFGHGLSYTKFEFASPVLEVSEIDTSMTTYVSVAVRNIGDMAGDEVVQLYVRDQLSSVPRPILELKGFERIHLAPGETRTVRIALPPESFALWDIKRPAAPAERRS